MNTEPSPEFIAELLNKSADELYQELGNQLRSKTLAAHHSSPSSNRSFARSWFKANADKIQKIICPHAAVKGLLHSHKEFQRVEIVIVLAEIITHHQITFAPVVLAVLLVKEGLGRFCESCDS